MSVRQPVITQAQLDGYIMQTRAALTLWNTIVKQHERVVNLDCWHGVQDGEGRVKPVVAMTIKALEACGATGCLGGILDMLLPRPINQPTATIHQLLGICTDGVPWHGTHGELDLFSSRRRTDVSHYEEARQRLINRLLQLKNAQSVRLERALQ